MYIRKKVEKSGEDMEKDPDMDIRKIMKDIEFLTTSNMTWKERKEVENRKVVALGGKPPKKQKRTLSVAQPMMKKQKEREQKMLEERLILGRFGAKFSGSLQRSVGKRKHEGGVLRSSEGNFRNGVLDVKHLLHPAPSRHSDTGNHVVNKSKKKGSKKKSGGKKKGGGKKCR